MSAADKAGGACQTNHLDMVSPLSASACAESSNQACHGMCMLIAQPDLTCCTCVRMPRVMTLQP
eukprot:2064412-Rhodomonas_salina.5